MKFKAAIRDLTNRTIAMSMRAKSAADEILLTSLCESIESGKPFTITIINHDGDVMSWLHEDETEDDYSTRFVGDETE